MKTVDFAFAALTPRERYKILIGTVVPRPIAWVTTVNGEGKANAAPFSFFNCLSADPAIVALGVEFRPDGAPKDTGRNIRESGVFTVNIVSDALLEAMNVTAVPFGAGVDELEHAGLAITAGTAVASPRIVGAPAALECRLHSFLDIGNSRGSEGRGKNSPDPFFFSASLSGWLFGVSLFEPRPGLRRRSMTSGDCGFSPRGLLIHIQASPTGARLWWQSPFLNSQKKEGVSGEFIPLTFTPPEP
jgi:flavin reductase (DIM6/NTAB) family NADH-FMN oxidoreductase RutF